MNILIADDHQLIRNGLKEIISSCGCFNISAESSTAEQLFEACNLYQPAIAVMDISMPGMGGIEAIRRINIKWPSIKILVYSMHSNKNIIKIALEAGACSYVTKSSKCETIKSALIATSQGKQYLSSDIQAIFEDKNIDESGDTLHILSHRELEVFRKLSEGLNTKSIAESLFLSEKTIANYISIVKKKLNVSSTQELMRIAVNENILSNNF